jgi:hypothetical protein
MPLMFEDPKLETREDITFALKVIIYSRRLEPIFFEQLKSLDKSEKDSIKFYINIFEKNNRTTRI